MQADRQTHNSHSIYFKRRKGGQNQCFDQGTALSRNMYAIYRDIDIINTCTYIDACFIQAL